MSIISSHREFILERLLLEYLVKGVIPTADSLQDDLEAYEKLHPSMAEPTSKQADFTVERGGESSAGKIQEIAKYVSDDVSIITREMKHLVEDGKAHYERWTAELFRLLNKSRRIENEIDSLLLMQGETTGFFSHVTDVFVDNNNLDMELTSAKIDTQETSVTLNPNPSYSGDASGGTRIDLSHLIDSDVSFSILSTTPTGYSPAPGSNLINAFTSPNVDGDGWLGTVTKSQTGEVIAEMKVQLHHTDIQKVSRIIFDSNVAEAGGNGTVACLHSTDGYQWYMVDHPSPVQSLDTGNISWHFPMTDMYWVKFIITKNNYDDSSGGAYYYKFGASSVRLYGHQYKSGSGSSLVTKALQPLDAEENAVPFTLASLDVCEENMLKDADNERITDVEYYLSASTNGTDWTGEVRCEPTSRTDRVWPSTVNFSGAAKIDNNGDMTDYSKFQGSIISDPLSSFQQLTSVFEYDNTIPDGFLQYNFKNASYAVVNTAIPLYNLNDTDTKYSPQHISNSMEVWRNIFDISIPDNTVRDIPAGWGKTDEHYYCSLYVASTDGIVLDFGPTSCIIDGVNRTGEVTLMKGMHSFQTTLGNWQNFYGSAYSVPANETQLREQDLIYPYNHKVIIEGFKYINAFEGERKYGNGADIVAQHYCKRTSAHELENNIPSTDRLKWFAFLKSVGTSSKPAGAVLLARDMSYADHANERCRILWNSGKGSFTFVKLRAELTTTDEAYTPVLYSYRIKVGS